MAEKLAGTQLIYITHFFNPNYFLFKVPSRKNFKLFELENKINVLANNWRQENNGNLQPRIGDVVAYYLAEWNKWVRVRVCSITYANMEIPSYLLWSIDHGQLIETCSGSLAELPEQLRLERAENVFQGGYGGFVPAGVDRTLRGEAWYICGRTWSHDVVRECSALIEKSAHTLFEIDDHLSSSAFYFGKVKLQFRSGDIYYLERFFETFAFKSGSFEGDIAGILANNEVDFKRLLCIDQPQSVADRGVESRREINGIHDGDREAPDIPFLRNADRNLFNFEQRLQRLKISSKKLLREGRDLASHRPQDVDDDLEL